MTGIVRLKNWVTDNFDLVNTYSVSTADDVVEIRGIRAAHYIRASDDRIELQFEHSGQPLTPGGSIDSRYDQVRVVVLED